MKVKLFSLFLVLSVLFFSCSNGVSEKGEGTISVDAGKLAELMTANSARSASRASLARSGDGDFFDYMSYTLKVKLSTEGGYSTSTEKQFKKSLSAAYFMRSEEEWAAMDETDLPEYDLIKEAKGTPITLSGVPIGRKIKVKAVLTFGYTFDMNGYLDSLRAYGYTDEMIETAKLYAELDIADYEGEDDFSVEGISDEFVVQPGENRIKITINDLATGEGGGSGSSRPDYSAYIDLILYSKTATDKGFMLYKKPSGSLSGALSPFDGIEVTSSFTDFCFDNASNLYYVDGTNYNIYKTNYGNSRFSTPVTLKDNGTAHNLDTLFQSNDKSNIKLCSDDQGQMVFCMAAETSDLHKCRIQCFYTDGEKTRTAYLQPDLSILSGISTGSSGMEYNYLQCLNIAASLGTPSQNGDNLNWSGFIYLSGVHKKEYDMSEGKDPEYDLIIAKFPIVCTNRSDGLAINDQTDVEVFKLSDADSEHKAFNVLKYCSWGANPYNVTDMIVHDGSLYVLIANNIRDTGDGSSGDNQTSWSVPIYSYGAMLKIDTENFDADHCNIYGYSSTNRTAIAASGFTSPLSDTPLACTISYTAYQPTLDQSEDIYFFGASKFVAIKPRELVIADDGYFYYEDSTDGFSFKNVNRLVSYNVTDNNLTAKNLNSVMEIYFDNEEDSDVTVYISGCTGSATTTCKHH